MTPEFGFHLTFDSDCINAGDPNLTDFQGDEFYESVCDLGAYGGPDAMDYWIGFNGGDMPTAITADLAPYRIYGVNTVPDGNTTTITALVETQMYPTRFNCATDARIDVAGTLNVTGSIGNRVVFRAIDQNFWYGFRIDDGTITFQFVDILYPSIAFIAEEGAVVELDNVIIEEADDQGIYIDQVASPGSIDINNVTISGCGDEGIYIYKSDVVEIDSVEVTECKKGLRAIQSDVTVTYTKFHANDESGASFLNCSSGSLDSCWVYENGSYGISLNNSEPVISRCVVHDNTDNGLVAYASSDVSVGGSSSGDGNVFFENGDTGGSSSERAEILLASSRPIFSNKHNDFVDIDADYLLYDTNYNSTKHAGAGNYWEGKGVDSTKWCYPNSCIDFSSEDGDTNHKAIIRELDDLEAFQLAIELEL